jgi:amino acid transporter
MVDYGAIDESAPIAEAFETVGVGRAATLISVAAVAGLTSVILVDIVAMGRIGFAMGRDGLLPARLAAVHPRWGTPYVITALTTAVVALLAGFVPLTDLANLVSIGTLAAFVVVSVAVPVLRRTRRTCTGPSGSRSRPCCPSCPRWPACTSRPACRSRPGCGSWSGSRSASRCTCCTGAATPGSRAPTSPARPDPEPPRVARW